MAKEGFQPVKIYKRGVKSVFKSPAMQELVRERAEEIVKQANAKVMINRSAKSRNHGQPFRAVVKKGFGTAYGVIQSTSFEGKRSISNGVLDEFLD